MIRPITVDCTLIYWADVQIAKIKLATDEKTPFAFRNNTDGNLNQQAVVAAWLDLVDFVNLLKLPDLAQLLCPLHPGFYFNKPIFTPFRFLFMANIKSEHFIHWNSLEHWNIFTFFSHCILTAFKPRPINTTQCIEHCWFTMAIKASKCFQKLRKSFEKRSDSEELLQRCRK